MKNKIHEITGRPFLRRIPISSSSSSSSSNEFPTKSGYLPHFLPTATGPAKQRIPISRFTIVIAIPPDLRGKHPKNSGTSRIPVFAETPWKPLRRAVLRSVGNGVSCTGGKGGASAPLPLIQNMHYYYYFTHCIIEFGTH